MATRGLLKGRASRFLIQSSFILNLLTRMSSLVRLEDKQKTINAAASQSQASSSSSEVRSLRRSRKELEKFTRSWTNVE